MACATTTRASRSLTGRRPVVEAAVGRVAARTPGVDVRRGVAVKGLLAGGDLVDGVPHVVGVVTDDGDELRADLVVDAGWAALGTPSSPRRHRCPPARRGARGLRLRLLRPPLLLRRRFGAARVRARPDAVRLDLDPHAAGGQRHVGCGPDRERGRRRHARRRATPTCGRGSIASYPLVAHWLDGEPITGIDVMAKIEDRHRSVRRRRRAGGHRRGRRSVTRGHAPIPPSAAAPRSACSTRASCATRCGELRPTKRSSSRRRGTTPPPRRSSPTSATRWDSIATASLRSTRRSPASPYETDDPAWLLGQALSQGGGEGPRVVARLPGDRVAARPRCRRALAPGVAERALELGATGEALPGPTRTSSSHSWPVDGPRVGRMERRKVHRRSST